MNQSKLLPYGHQTIEDQDIQAVTEVLKSDWLTTGPKVREFEKAIAEISGAKHGVAVNSGTAALHCAMAAFNLCKGDEVIVTPMTFAASANCIAYMGATPVFADVDSETLLINPIDVEKKITNKTKGIIAVDYAGQPCDYDSLRTIADKNNLFLVADACHSIGGDLNGKKVGSLADITIFSFHPVKHITTGEGGMAVCASDELAERMRRFRTHGIVSGVSESESWLYEMQELGFNYRITDFQCALGLSQLSRLPEWVEKRRAIAASYDYGFNEVEELQPLGKRDGAGHAYHLYVINIIAGNRPERRKQVFNYLRENRILVQVHYIPVHLHPYYKKTFNTHKGLCPVAEHAYEGIISLPMFPAMQKSDPQRVIDTVKEALLKTEGI
jgi:perosamine synthetase